MPEFSAIKDYWEWAHETNNMSSLTGDTLNDHLDVLHATDLLQSNSNVLCIGVGDGIWVHQLAECLAGTGSITAVDISGTARARVAKIASALSPETFYRIKPRDCFDLALSLWVTPHLTTEMVAAQFRAVIPALTVSGVFAVHYNEPYPGTAFDEETFVAKWESETDALRSGLMRIWRAKFLEIVADAGGNVLGWPFHQEASDYDEVIFAAHIARRHGPDASSPGFAP
jgi:hypothetical protein